MSEEYFEKLIKGYDTYQMIEKHIERLNELPLDVVRFHERPLNCDKFELVLRISAEVDQTVVDLAIMHTGDGEVHKRDVGGEPLWASKCKHKTAVLRNTYHLKGLDGIQAMLNTFYANWIRYTVYAKTTRLDPKYARSRTSLTILTIRDWVLGNYSEEDFKHQ